MNRSRLSVIEILGGALPGFRQECSSAGSWACAAGTACWCIEPTSAGFWALFTQGEDETKDLGPPDAWPWPMKRTRKRPGAPSHWHAEMFLQGRHDEAARLRDTLRLLNDRLANPQPRELEVPTANSPEWQHLVTDALDLSAESNGADLRVETREGAQLVIRHDQESLLIQGRLLRLANPLTPASQAVVEDLLSVANARLRGCRTVLGESGASVESRIRPEELSGEAIRRSVASVAQAQVALGPVCQAVSETGSLAESYQQCLLTA